MIAEKGSAAATGESSARKLRMISGFVDQLLSSISNGLMTVAVAAVSSVETFGGVALAMTALLALVGIQRGAVGNQILLLSGTDPERLRADGGRAVTFGLAAGTVAGLIMAGVTVPYLGTVGALVAVSVPIVLAQDSLRYVAFALGKPGVAAAWDGVWFVGTALVMAAAFTESIASAAVVAGWAAFAALSLLGMAYTLRVQPMFGQMKPWIARDWKHRVRFGADTGMEQTTVFLVLTVVGLILTASASGALRGATVLLSPIAVACAAIQLIVISEAARSHLPPPRVWWMLLGSTAVLAVGTVAIALALVLLPDGVGGAILGDTFAATRNVMPWVAAEYAVSALVFSLGAYLRTFQRSIQAIRLRVVSTIAALVIVPATAAITGSASGAAAGLLCATAAAALYGLAVNRPWRADADTKWHLEKVE